MSTLNLGIVAHVDAGKTSLTERLLYAAGVIDEIGSVDDGSTQTDSMALERQRGITIRSAVVSFTIGDVTVNLIDTPGHPDFIAEVERVLSVLDGAVLVISAVEGVQAQTRVLLRALRRLRIPTLIFVNKVDRGGARYDGVLRDIADKLVPEIVPMGSVVGLGTRAADVQPFGPGDGEFAARLVDVLAENDDDLLASYVADSALPYERLRRGLAAQTTRGLLHPVFFGSAITGVGVAALSAGIASLLPPAQVRPTSRCRARSSRSSGAGRREDRLRADVRRRAAHAGPLGVGIEGDGTECLRRRDVRAHGYRDGGPDRQGVGPGRRHASVTRSACRTAVGEHHFAPPTLETVVLPVRAADRGACTRRCRSSPSRTR